MAGRPRGFETFGDMLRSLAVVGAVVAVVVVLGMRHAPDEERAVDARPVLDAVAVSAPFEALVPSDPPEGWRSTSARISLPGETPFSWYVGYVTPEGRFVAVSETDGERDAFLVSLAADGEPAGTSEAGGRAWERLEREDGSRRALVREGRDGAVHVVTGTAGFDVLEDLAGRLEPVGPASSATAAPRG